MENEGSVKGRDEAEEEYVSTDAEAAGTEGLGWGGGIWKPDAGEIA